MYPVFINETGEAERHESTVQQQYEVSHKCHVFFLSPPHYLYSLSSVFILHSSFINSLDFYSVSKVCFFLTCIKLLGKKNMNPGNELWVVTFAVISARATAAVTRLPNVMETFSWWMMPILTTCSTIFCEAQMLNLTVGLRGCKDTGLRTL